MPFTLCGVALMKYLTALFIGRVSSPPVFAVYMPGYPIWQTETTAPRIVRTCVHRVVVVPNFKVLINARRRAIPPDAAQMHPPGNPALLAPQEQQLRVRALTEL